MQGAIEAKKPIKPLPQGPKYLIILHLHNPNLNNYDPKTEYLNVGSFGTLGYVWSHLEPFRSLKQTL